MSNLSKEFKWVAKATDKKLDRAICQYVTVQGGVMYGTNMHLIHTSPTNLFDGIYCPKSGELLGRVNYVDFDRIMPRQTLLKETGFEYKHVCMIENPAFRDCIKHCSGNFYNFKYYKKTFTYKFKPEKQEVTKQGILKTTFKNGCISIIMPKKH